MLLRSGAIRARLLLLSPGSTETTSGTRQKMFRRLIATSATWFTIPIRLGLAAVMIAHGAQKVLGSFNGPGFKTFTAGTT
ncbi:MAG TPA: hypothetical protein VGP98_09615, partial [Pyrinomonadaceae bacterium]|nr:hypothetical protein [Pyrinomonadaceae bacterium]